MITDLRGLRSEVTHFRIETTVNTEISEDIEAAITDGRIMRFPFQTDKPDY